MTTENLKDRTTVIVVSLFLTYGTTAGEMHCPYYNKRNSLLGFIPSHFKF